MAKQAIIYFAVVDEDQTIADIILVHLRNTGYKCIDRSHVPTVMNPATDIEGTMSDADVIVLIDSYAFRQQKPDYELQFAQQLNKPLIVISLQQKVDESKSTWRVRLFDFTNARHRNWQAVIDTIIEVTQEATRDPYADFLF